MTRLYILVVLALPLATMPAMACGMEVVDRSVDLEELLAEVDEADAAPVEDAAEVDEADAAPVEDAVEAAVMEVASAFSVEEAVDDAVAEAEPAP